MLEKMKTKLHVVGVAVAAAAIAGYLYLQPVRMSTGATSEIPEMSLEELAKEEEKWKSKAEPTKRQIVPEYKRTLDQVVIHLQSKWDVKSVGSERVYKINYKTEYHKDLLLHLPSYSRIIALHKGRHSQELRAVLLKLNRIGEEVAGKGYQSIFTQDFFETVRVGNEIEIIVPSYPPMQDSQEGSFLLARTFRNSGFKAVVSDLFFEGGDTTYDEMGNKKILYIGSKTIETNRWKWSGNPYSKWNGRKPSKRPKRVYKFSKGEILENFRQEFNVDQVVVLPKVSDSIFHIDQAFLIYKPGEVVVAGFDLTNQTLEDYLLRRFENKKTAMYFSKSEKARLTRVQNLLKTIKQTFLDLGYTVHTLPVNLSQVEKFQSYINGIPFTHKVTGQPSLLLPIYPDQNGDYNISSGPNKKAIDFYKEKGLDVIPVKDFTFEKKGNIHCITNVLR